jgi:hypothetical protein
MRSGRGGDGSGGSAADRARGRRRLAGCGGSSKPAPTTPARSADGRCPVTAPGRELKVGDGGFSYGDAALAVALWPRGWLPAGTLPDGGSYAEIATDGSITAKLGWWRGEDGTLRVEGERLDASAPPLQADIPAGYGSSGLQPTRLTFATTGCWRVTGSVGDARLEFVLRVYEL